MLFFLLLHNLVNVFQFKSMRKCFTAFHNNIHRLETVKELMSKINYIDGNVNRLIAQNYSILFIAQV